MSNLKSKIENFWYYNKYIVIFAVFVLACVLILANAQKGISKTDLTLSLVGNTYILDEDTERLQTDFSAYINDINNDGKSIVYLNRLYLTDYTKTINDVEQDQQRSAKIGLEFTNGLTPLFIMDETFNSAYANGDYMQPLNDILGADLKAPIYSVPVSNNSLLEKYNINTGGLYLAVKLVPEYRVDDEKLVAQSENAKKLAAEILKYQ